MELKLTVPDDALPLNIEEVQWLKVFLQGVCDRVVVGGIRHGGMNARRRFLSHLMKEAAAYNGRGNMEQLLNVAAYALLESYAPQNPKFHWDATVASVTRKP